MTSDLLKKIRDTKGTLHAKMYTIKGRNCVYLTEAGHEPTDWFQIGKGVRQVCILSPCLFNLYAEYIIRNAGLAEAQTGIKIAGRNSNNLR